MLSILKSRAALLVLTTLCGVSFTQSAIADVILLYNEFSSSPTIGRGDGTSTNPESPGYGAMRIFIQKVVYYTGALPAGQKVIFKRDQSIGRSVNALRAGVQFANKNAEPHSIVSDPSWGFIYNSVPFGMNFKQTLGFLYDAKDDVNRNGVELAQAVLDRRGGTQIVFPVVASTMQGSGYFPRPIGKPNCNPGDSDCAKEGAGIGLAGLCTSGWRIRYLAPPEDILSRACDILVQRGVVSSKTLQFYPAIGGQSVLVPMQKGSIRGFEFITPLDDLVAFFPVKNPTSTRPLGDPDTGNLDCSPAIAFPMPPDTKSNCSQNIGQLGARYAHHPSWHQPFLLSWMHIDKVVWNALNANQRTAILRAAKESVRETYDAAKSIVCQKLKEIIDFNDGIYQRSLNGRLRLVEDRPVSAKMTIAVWPDDALKVLREARDDYLVSLEGPKNPSERSEAQKDFSDIFAAWTKYAATVGATNKFDPGEFPAEKCNLVK